MVDLKNVSRQYQKNKNVVNALGGISLQVARGEFVVVRGPSGSGKTTLLLAIGAMLTPTEGTVAIEGRDIYALSQRERARLRAEQIGFVFQMFHLLPYLNCIENVLLPIAASKRKNIRDQAESLLQRLGLHDRIRHRPEELSAGERQRTAIARALFYQPKLILADEPTGNLDPENADQVFQILADFKNGGGTVIMVTHGAEADPYADRILQLDSGRLIS
ncbi:ABC transporter ATP-binding protein [candidate division KSB1 bacterium]|nr:ABC transporter ATP-binding protein [candidate division KSB1 bacterium]